MGDQGWILKKQSLSPPSEATDNNSSGKWLDGRYGWLILADLGWCLT